MSVDFNGYIWLFEFKVVEQGPRARPCNNSVTGAMRTWYRGRGKPIHLVGV